MAIPASYTEAELSDFMVAVLGPTATALGWSTVSESLNEAINDTLVAYDVADIANATDIPKLRAIARWQAWRWAADARAIEFNQATGDQRLELKPLYDSAVAQRDYWHGQARPYLSQFAVTATPIVHIDDPVDAPIRYHALRYG